jgi:hypothetical protein
MPSGSYDRAVLIWDICKGNEFAAVMLEPAVDCISSREEEQLVVAADIDWSTSAACIIVK